MKATQQTQHNKLFFSVDETMSICGLGRNSIYNLINSGKLLTIKVGRRRLISASSLTDLDKTLAQ